MLIVLVWVCERVRVGKCILKRICGCEGEREREREREGEREVDCAYCMRKRERVEDARKRGLKLP